ncbi:helix-turn-helix domain-containing protein [Streptomyces sp. MI02-7b]|uniref:helix-turn-helix domain-containing protein n=1 Tax=Streptomyces sp. MI02-7b TaxID=462941 RepID=UPI0029AB9BF2|nr:helix-turn-helix domain-containing protein [Streptomyces sp. MI02-7b]MDX3076154.1 hypothetical protein [Streptomyces sp. MI02-7b]
MERFQAGQKNPEVAAALRVSERPVERWRRAWRERGQAGGCCRRAPRCGLGSARTRSSGWYGSWSAVRRPTGGRSAVDARSDHSGRPYDPCACPLRTGAAPQPPADAECRQGEEIAGVGQYPGYPGCQAPDLGGKVGAGVRAFDQGETDLSPVSVSREGVVPTSTTTCPSSLSAGQSSPSTGLVRRHVPIYR